MRFEGKVALVTGAGGGIVEPTARRLAIEGAAVVINDVTAKGAEKVVAAITGDGGKAKAVVGSITDKAAVEAMVKDAVDSFGGLHVLINNAGINRNSLLKKMSERSGIRSSTSTLKGTFLCA